ncbi:invasion associated locus B family protein [Bradyrhizobium diazoefficiens]|nr:invasion associated locus B family protein [Bradyrhizobium diazoefficiens]MBR0848903.1 invasion associated locus B family protein [Bradyrhizobium diazoefficiens]
MYCILLRSFGTMAFACLVATPVIAQDASLPALTYSPWTKFCMADTCFVSRDGRLNVVGADGRSNVDCGPVVAAVLIERTGDTKKTLRVTLPNRVSLERGVRIIIGQDQAIERPFVNCFANGCMADYDAGAELVDRLKQGRMLVLKAIDKASSPISLTVPLVDFGNAYDSPPQEPKAFEEVLSKEEMQARLDRERRAGEERKALCGAR